GSVGARQGTNREGATEAPRPVPRAPARAPRRGGARPHLRDRRRRPAAHAARLPLPGLVRRRGPAARCRGACREGGGRFASPPFDRGTNSEAPRCRVREVEGIAARQRAAAAAIPPIPAPCRHAVTPPRPWPLPRPRPL